MVIDPLLDIISKQLSQQQQVPEGLGKALKVLKVLRSSQLEEAALLMAIVNSGSSYSFSDF